MRVKINDKIYRLKEIESGLDSLMELVEEPKYKKGDKVMLKSGCKDAPGLLYFRETDEWIGKPITVSEFDQSDFVYEFSDCPYYLHEDWLEPYVEELKEGKRWNAEKLCIEDIPVRKFKNGDKVRIKAGVSSKTHGSISPMFVTSMDKLIGKELTVEDYGNLFVRCDGYYFSEEWLEPVEELKKGDLAIFWDNGAQHRASVRMYGSLFTHDYLDTGGVRWDNAIKFESKEQFEKLINGEL